MPTKTQSLTRSLAITGKEGIKRKERAGTSVIELLSKSYRSLESDKEILVILVAIYCVQVNMYRLLYKD